MVGTNIKIYNYGRSPLEQVYRLDFDKSEILDNEDTHKYQTIFVSLKWDIYLRIFCICTHVMTMYSFIYVPRQGHMDRVKRIYSYLDKIINECIIVRKELPD